MKPQKNGKKIFWNY